MNNILQPTEAKRIIDELLDYDSRRDIGIYIRGRMSEFKDDNLFWIKLSDRLTRTTLVDEHTKWQIMNSYYHEEDWNKEQLYDAEDRYIFLQEYIHQQIQIQLDNRKSRVLKINSLPQLAIRYYNYTNSSPLQKKLYGVRHINEILNTVHHSTNYFLFDIQKNYLPEDNTTALDTLLHLYFSDNILDALNTVGSCLKSYNIVIDPITERTETKVDVVDSIALYDLKLTQARKVFKCTFTRTYREYIKKLPSKNKEFEAYKKWEIARWELVLKYYSNNDWGYDIIKKYVDQIRRYKQSEVVPLTPEHDYSFGIDKVYKPYITKFFETIEDRYRSETKSLNTEKYKKKKEEHVPIIHPDSTADDIATLLTAKDYSQCKPVYFMCKGNVLSHLLHQLYTALRTPYMKTHINDAIEASKKIMYRKGIIKIENAKEIPLSKYSQMDRTKMYEGIKSFDKHQKLENEYESHIASIVKSVLNSIQS